MLSPSAFSSAGNTYLDLDYSGYHKNFIQQLFIIIVWEVLRFDCSSDLYMCIRVRKYAKFGVFYANIVQMTPQRLRRESLRREKFSVTNREPLRLQKFSVKNTVLSLPFSQQIKFTLIVNVVNLN